jgi:2-C-methyl-D-erythritol 2,4-cyclodiphosphate synthase
VDRPNDGSAADVRTGASWVGIGYDSHRFAPGGPLRLGGIDIDVDVHCAGHSDGDAICHAVTDAILGAANAGDIGEMFPDSDPANRGRDSVEMLRAAVQRVRHGGRRVTNVDVTVIAEHPKVGPYREAMRDALCDVLDVSRNAVSIKGKTNEGMGWIGRGEGIAVIAVAMLHGAE